MIFFTVMKIKTLKEMDSVCFCRDDMKCFQGSITVYVEFWRHGQCMREYGYSNKIKDYKANNSKRHPMCKSQFNTYRLYCFISSL